jgi:phosphoglycolate phosphatase
MDKWIIFDFDGTLADTLQAWVETWNFLAQRYGYRHIEPADYAVLRAKSSWAIKKELGIPWWRIGTLERAGRKKFAERIATQQLYPHIPEVLKDLKGRGFHLAILTSSSAESVETCLRNNGCEGIFDFVYAGSALFKKGRKLKALLKTHGINPSQGVYVGDETRDVVAARFAKVKVVSVTWGLNTKEVLRLEHPDVLVDQPQQLLDLSF